MSSSASPQLSLKDKLYAYAQLMRIDRPIGTLLLLWPTLWALWLANEGMPPWHLLVIFTVGVFIMRAAGCVINDYADRNFDGHVERTQHRPLAAGKIAPRNALILFAGLGIAAFALVCLTNTFTIALSFGGIALATCYPFMKRHTHLPQLVLGAAFSWGIPMAFSASLNELPPTAWLVFTANLLWTVVYDTQYAMVDRDDDLKIGIKSTAILFGEQDKMIIGCLQGLTIMSLIVLANRFDLGFAFYMSLAVATGLFVYQQILIRGRERQACFKAFLSNNYVGAAIFAGVALSYIN
ncbi:4-hydroxybenzoate octaprenyltransferase [uncultured Pseudoteredinibacter sp.]|uniref:4-hydroxybenzoate octaprenyltransferase n=1 Tax=uncultured Pseudoteredinibacter sp. TaxID=1641701 RepID=UPI00262149F6|nr:4-hydroxybenzoate octaprenyltransferase [uncultured Pseudoteredinibacter sp.]